MKFFWALIGILVIAAGVMLIRSPRRGAPVPSAETPAISAPEPVQTSGTDAPTIVPHGDSTAPVATTETESDAASLGWARESGEPPRFVDVRRPGETRTLGGPSGAPDITTPERDASPPARERLASVDDTSGALDAALGLPPEPISTDVPTVARPDDDVRAQRPADATAVNAPRSASSGEKLVLNDRFALPGSGTDADPYVLAWDVLLSAQEDYRPRQGKKELPEWATRLDGKYVLLSGFLAIPMMADEAQEILLMRNEWDGCCVGIPPTAYDSVEVKLRKSSTLQRHMINFGAVKGRIRIDPYLWKDWLISLYRFEDAEIEDTGF